MRAKPFKIRNMLVHTDDSLVKEKIAGEKMADSYRQEDHNQFSELMSMFTAFMKKSEGSRSEEYQSMLEPRDKEIVIPLPQFVNGTTNEKLLKQWVAKVFKTIFSSSFNYFSKNEMNFEQAKIYCSENIFKNIVLLNRNYSLSPQEFQMIDKHINNGVLNYLGKKYPLTDSTDVNKKLEEIVHEVDNMQALSNNYLAFTSVEFQYRQDSNYNDLIMRFLNQLMEIIDSKSSQSLTNYQQFQSFMASLFEKVTDKDWMQKTDKQQQVGVLLTHMEQIIQEKGVEEGGRFKVGIQQERKEKYKRKMQENQKYKAIVKQYTNYLIGRKIPEHTPKYSEKEISSRNIIIKSPTILRILTKWCQQLWQKYQEVGYFTNRSESVKVQRGETVNSLLMWMRKQLDKKIEIEKEQIVKFLAEISDNNFQMQSNIMKHEIQQDTGGDYLDQVQKACGKFSSKIAKNTHSYIIAYLNKLIHGLMKISKEIFEENNLYHTSIWPSPPNLLSFKIGDVMRCKCSSKEKQIIRLYKYIQRLSKQNPQNLKIVRIKNRLKSGTNDILINVKFNNLILCEVQLAIKSQSSHFIKCSNLFHHYIYELQRTNFGPLAELCSIWNTLDRRMDVYEQLIEEESFLFSKNKHSRLKLNKKRQMVPYIKPFICNQCNVAFFHNNYLRQHLKCKNFQVFICSNCQIQQSSEEILKEELIKSSQLKANVLNRIGKDEALPKNGLCIFLEDKNPRLQLFRCLNYERNKKDYLLGIKGNQIYQVENIKTPQLNSEFRRKHLIFAVSQKVQDLQALTEQKIKHFMLTQMVKTSYRKQKESISLMGEQLSTPSCRQILAVGTKTQKQNVKNLFLADNKLDQLPFDPEEFSNLRWLTLSKYYIIVGRNVFSSLQKLDRLKSLTIIAWASGNFKELPEQLFELSSLQSVNFFCNQITFLSPKIANLKYLKELQLIKNKLTSLPDSLGQCKNLVSLRLQQNALTELPLSLFSLPNLQNLLLDSNQLTQLPEELGCLKKLKQLNVTNNSLLRKMPQSISSLQQLQFLDCSRTEINTLPDDLKKCKKLKELNFNDTKIAKLPSSIKELSKLYKLSVSAIGEQIGQLKHVRKLTMNNCKIKKLFSLKNLTFLQSLSANKNQLTGIDDQLESDFPNLTNFSLENNQLIIFPDLRKMKSIVSLNLTQNFLSLIPEEFIGSCASLQELILNNNYFYNLPLALTNLKRLKKLSLSFNQLEYLFDPKLIKIAKLEELQFWPNLTSLILNANQLKELPGYVCKCSKLTDLNISSNKLICLPKGMKSMIKLERLDAHSNAITLIPDQLSELLKIHELQLSQNQIKKIPQSIGLIRTLKAFLVDFCPVQEVECSDWVLQNEKKIKLGHLSEIVLKLKQKQDELTKQKKCQEKQFPINAKPNKKGSTRNQNLSESRQEQA